MALGHFGEHRSVREDADDGENGSGRLRLRHEIQRVVRHRMGRVVVGVVVVVRVIMAIVVRNRPGNRFQQTIQMRCRREMAGNVIEIEAEQRGDKESNPPPRRFRREATSVLLARVHKNRG